MLKRAQSINTGEFKKTTCHEEKEAASGKISNTNKLISTGAWARKQHREDEGGAGGLVPYWRNRRKLTQPKGMCFGGGMWFGWRQETWAASETSSSKKLPLCSLNYMAAFSLSVFFFCFVPCTCSEGKHAQKEGWRRRHHGWKEQEKLLGWSVQGWALASDLPGEKISSFFWIKDRSPVLSNNICKPPEYQKILQ